VGNEVGGAGGGGKSQALWYGALQFVMVPGYAALVLRRTYADLAKAGALMERSKEYLAGSGAVWNERDKKWTFPSGATVTFGYLQHEDDKYQYKSSEFQYVAFDELTDFTESQYTFLFTRLRKKQAGPVADVPLRMRSASNPGGLPRPVLEGCLRHAGFDRGGLLGTASARRRLRARPRRWRCAGSTGTASSRRSGPTQDRVSDGRREAYPFCWRCHNSVLFLGCKAFYHQPARLVGEASNSVLR
jgi:hypothetical protein